MSKNTSNNGSIDKKSVLKLKYLWEKIPGLVKIFVAFSESTQAQTAAGSRRMNVKLACIHE
jgi:hypothetical protein